MTGMIEQWLANFKDYTTMKQHSIADNWRSYMYNNLASQNCFCFNIQSIFLKYRSLLVALVLVNVVPLSMQAVTYHIFHPELDWKCKIDDHTGLTSICRSWNNRLGPIKKYAPCVMDLGVDFEWNSTFTSTPMLEFGAYCPLERTVEPKLVNFVGSFCGCLLGGIFIDTLGRKNMALITTFFSIVTSFSYHMSSDVVMYTYQEFIKGLFSSVAAMSLLTWAVELSKPQYASITITSFFLCGGVGEMLTIGVAYLVRQWRLVMVIISAIGIGLLPVLFLIPPSLRYMIAKGKINRLPKHIRFIDGMIPSARAKDCLARSQSNRLYATNALLLLILGFTSHLLTEVILIKYHASDIFQRQIIHKAIIIVGYVLAIALSFLHLFMYLLNVFTLTMGGIFAIVATSTNYSESPWSLSRVFTGTSLMLVTLAISLTFTTMKQIPTLNRGFYVSSMNASLMLGSLLYVILQSWCLEKDNAQRNFCSEISEDSKLLTSGGVLCVSVALAFANTCLTRNISLPHSYQECSKYRVLPHAYQESSKYRAGANEETDDISLNPATHTNGNKL